MSPSWPACSPIRPPWAQKTCRSRLRMLRCVFFRNALPIVLMARADLPFPLRLTVSFLAYPPFRGAHLGNYVAPESAVRRRHTLESLRKPDGRGSAFGFGPLRALSPKRRRVVTSYEQPALTFWVIFAEECLYVSIRSLCLVGAPATFEFLLARPQSEAIIGTLQPAPSRPLPSRFARKGSKPPPRFAAVQSLRCWRGRPFPIVAV